MNKKWDVSAFTTVRDTGKPIREYERVKHATARLEAQVRLRGSRLRGGPRIDLFLQQCRRGKGVFLAANSDSTIADDGQIFYCYLI